MTRTCTEWTVSISQELQWVDVHMLTFMIVYWNYEKECCVANCGKVPLNKDTIVKAPAHQSDVAVRYFLLSDRQRSCGQRSGQCSDLLRGGDQMQFVEFDRCPRHCVLAWTKSTTGQLIEEVKLFNLSHPDYKNIKKKNEVWEQIGRSLGTSCKFTHFPFIFINYLIYYS